MMKIKRDDLVKVIAGKDKGKEGKVIAVNMVTKHTKPSAQNQAGGIVTQEAPIDASNVMYVYKGKATRIGFAEKDGKKVRVAKQCNGEVID